MFLFLTIFVIFCNLILGFITFNKNPKGGTNKLFLILTIILSLWAFTNYQSLQINSPQVILFWIRSVMVVTAALLPTMFLLVKTFPNKPTGLSRGIIALIITFVLITQFLSATSLVFRRVEIYDSRVIPMPGAGMPVFALNIFLFLILTIVVLVNKYRKYKGIEKEQIKYLVFGGILTFVLGAFTNFVFVNFLGITSLVAFGPLFTLILVGFIAYAIVKHRFLDITYLVARTASYTLLLILVAAIYAALIFTATELLPEDINRTYISIVLALVVAFSFNPLRLLLEKVTDKVLFKGRYNTEELLGSLTRIMAGEINLESLTERLLSTLINQMRLTKGAFLIIEKRKVKNIMEVGFKDEKMLSEDRLAQLLYKNKETIYVFEELENERIKELFRRLDISVALLLTVKEKKIGLLVLGPKASGDIYGGQDIEVLEIFAPQAAVALQNALRYEEIRSFSEKLKMEVEKATVDLRKANKRLKGLDKLKDEFISMAAHEIRAPMTAIKGYLSMVSGGDAGRISQKARSYLQDADAINERLIRLVNNMLNVSKIEEGKLIYQMEKVSLIKAIQEVYHSFRFEAERKDLKYYLDIPHGIMDEVFVDPDRVREVIGNLISNAVKFTDKGSIDVKVSQPKKNIIRFEVIDSGPGITKEEQEKLFRKFYRVETTGGKTMGTGLGLYVSRLLINKFGGEIGVDSEFGKGSTFWFEIPLSKKG